MRGSARRTRTAVSDSPKIIHALSRADLQVFRLRHAFRQFSHTWWEIVEDPMHPGAARGIGVVHDQSKCFSAVWRVIPRKLRGDI